MQCHARAEAPPVDPLRLRLRLRLRCDGGLAFSGASSLTAGAAGVPLPASTVSAAPLRDRFFEEPFCPVSDALRRDFFSFFETLAARARAGALGCSSVMTTPPPVSALSPELLPSVELSSSSALYDESSLSLISCQHTHQHTQSRDDMTPNQVHVSEGAKTASEGSGTYRPMRQCHHICTGRAAAHRHVARSHRAQVAC